MKKGLQNKFRMCAVCLAALAFPAVSIAQTTNDLKGFWERTTVTGKTSGQFAAHPNKYYKAIGDEGFLLIELPPQANPNIKGFFTAKGGNCQRTSETVMVEGNAEVKTHKNDKGMVVEWTDGNGEEIT